MVNNFMAVLKTCDKCSEKYMPAHQSAECPHERLVDLMVNKPDRLIQKTPEAEKAHQEFVKRCSDSLARLLTPDKIDSIRFNKPASSISPKLPSYVSVLLMEQDAKTASILNDLHQQKVREIFEEIKSHFVYGGLFDANGKEERIIGFSILKSEWQIFESRILGGK